MPTLIGGLASIQQYLRYPAEAKGWHFRSPLHWIDVHMSGCVEERRP